MIFFRYQWKEVALGSIDLKKITHIGQFVLVEAQKLDFIPVDAHRRELREQGKGES